MTATLPDGMEHKNALAQACADAVGSTAWGSEYPEEDGVRNLIVAVTGVRDEVGDIIVPGAFEHTLGRLEPKGCMGHDWNRVTGYPEAIEEVLPGDPRLPREDRLGRPWPAEAGALYVRHRYHTDTDDGLRAYKDAKFLGPRLACSIGYVDPKDDNGKPLYSYKKIDPISGKMTRFLPRLDLFEYSQVLHGAHPLAGGLKDGKPKRLERKQRPDMELKATVKLVRDSAYWRLPVGTPIRPGMKPQGPKAQRITSAGQHPDENAGVVEVDANNLRIKPTAKGKQKGNVAVGEAYSGIMGLLDDDEADPFGTGDGDFLVDDNPDNKINKGEQYNPLDILVANAIPPAEVEEDLRNADWDSDRLGDSAERQGEIDSYVADVTDAYREKYNAELVRQNDTGDGDVPEDAGSQATGTPETTTETVAPGYDEPTTAPSGEGDGTPPLAAGQQPQSSRPTTEEWQAAQRDMAAAGIEPAAEEPAPAQPQAPRMVVHNGDPVKITAVDGDSSTVYNTRTEQTYSVPSSELLAGGASLDKPVTVKLNQDQRYSADLAFGEDENPEEVGGQLTAEGLVINNVAEALWSIDNQFDIMEDNPDRKRSHGRTLKAVRAKIAKLAKPIEDGQADIGKFPDGTKPSPKLIALLGDATWVTGQRVATWDANGERGETTADGWLVRGNNTTIYPLHKKKVADDPLGVQPVQGARGASLLNAEGARLLAPYLPNGGKRDGAEDGATPAEALPDNGAAPGQPSTEVVPEESPAESTVDQMAAPDVEPATTPSEADVTRMVIAKPDVAADRAAQMSDAELAAFDAAMSDRAAALGKPGQRTPGHQAVADEIARRAESGDTAGEPLGETDPAFAGQLEPDADQPVPAGPEGEQPIADEGLVEDIDQAQTEAIEENETISGDELADAEELSDASFGVTEAPDGEFEVDADIADRQDRITSLLTRAEAGSLDLSAAPDDELRTTRADIVDEIKLQRHLERRRAGDRALTRQQADQEAVDASVADQEVVDEPQPTGPKPRPGVAGAAEDLADALDDGDQARIDEATARLRASINRSRSDSEVVAEIRAMLGGELDPAALRDAVQRLRDEQRAKRNDSARRRRAARRFERERLRSLLGQVEAEMRNRNLDYDPLPDDDGNVTLDLATAPAVAWSSETRHEDWSGQNVRVDRLNGANYQASIEAWENKPPTYSWAVTGDNGVVLATGSGTAADPDSARASIEIALDTQRRLGLIPVDAQVPQGSVPQDTSATPLASVVDALGDMRQRVADGRKVNPITGQPDPFGDGPQPLPVPERSRFLDPGQVRKYLEVHGVTTRTDETRNVVDTYRWDTAKMTPGGAFVVVDDLQGKPQVVHTVTGAAFPPPLIGKTGLGRADLFRYATIAESIRDVDGSPVDWSLGARELMSSLQSRKFTSGGDNDGGRGDIRTAVIDRLTREKIAAGQFTHALVQRDTAFVDGVTNESRRQFVLDQHRALAQLISVRRGKPDAFDKKTLDAAAGARTLAALGAPDAAAALLTRRAAEVRERYGADAPSRGSAVLDSLATGYLGMFSPVRSHGERVRSIKTGERLFLTEHGEDGGLRSFRALSAGRRDPRGNPSDQIVPVIDEKTGEQRFLHINVSKFRIEDTEERTFGYAPLSGDLSHGDYVVAGPGEEPPATAEDLRARQFDDAAVIPQDVLDAAAEALPESAGETAARRAVPTGEGKRPPRRSSPVAPRRTAQPPAAPQPVRGEQHLAQAQGRIEGGFLGMPFSYGDKPERGSFDSVDAVREHLAAQATDERWKENPQQASSAKAVVAQIDAGGMKLSPGGVFLVRKDGVVTHASTGFGVWPPSPGKEIQDDLRGGGYTYTQAAGLRVARALESGVFDGEQIDWSGDGSRAVKQTNEISRRNGNFHPIRTAQRAAYRDGVLDAPKPTKTDIAMFTGIADNAMDLTGPNPEAFDRTALIGRRTEYSNSGGYTADSKKSAGLVDRVNAELRMAEPLAKTAPLDAVRRLTRLADELDGQTITMRIDSGFARQVAVHGATPDKVKTLTPSEDLRKAAKMITDVYDPDKISESARFRQANMIGQVELTKPKITMGRSWEDPNGVAARRLESDIKESGGIRFYRDENGLLHATFDNSAGVPIDIADGQVQVGGGVTGAIKLAPDGRLTLSYMSANRLVVIEAPPSSWKFTPESGDSEDIDRDTDGDFSGPENESAQAGEDAAPDNVEDIPGAEKAVTTEDKIRKIYKEFADGPQDWVPLRWIRPRLGDVDRAEQDRALMELTKTGLVHLVASANRKALTDDDHSSAIKIGGEDKHMLAIEDEDDADYGKLEPQAPEAPPIAAQGDVDGKNRVQVAEERIRAAYAELAEFPEDWIRLARIRPMLGDIDRADADAALLAMMKTGFVHLSPDSNTKMLTPEDHEAAIRIGSEDLHIIAIEGPGRE